MPSHSRQADPFSHSMTDLMAGVAVTFLLLAAIFMAQVSNRAEEEVKEGRVAKDRLKEITSTDQRAILGLKTLRDSLSNDLDLHGLVELIYDAEQDPFLLTIVFDRGRLRFDPGDCAIRKDTLQVIASSFGAILTQVCEIASSGLVQSITLEGHTDNRPFFPSNRGCGVESLQNRCVGIATSAECSALGFANNVRLSAARAQNVFFEMRNLLRGRNDIISCLDTKFVVAGRGPVEPADGKNWQDSRSELENERNRRVVIKVRAISRTLE
jgi:flagellar motor protein MotB